MQNAFRVNKKIINHKPLTQYSYSFGFGLLEVMIGVTILTMVVGGVLYLERAAIKSNVLSREKTQAYNLGREVVEIIRASRDTKWIDEQLNDWNEDFSGVNKTCILDSNNLISCSSGENSGEVILGNTKYERYFTLDNISSGNFNSELISQTDSEFFTTDTNTDNKVITKLTVVIKWQSYGKTNTTEIPVVLSDWKKS